MHSEQLTISEITTIIVLSIGTATAILLLLWCKANQVIMLQARGEVVIGQKPTNKPVVEGQVRTNKPKRSFRPKHNNNNNNKPSAVK